MRIESLLPPQNSHVDGDLYVKPAADFRSVSEEDFARLSTDDKFRHIHLGMLELTRTLVELAAAATAATQERPPATAGERGEHPPRLAP